MLIVVVAELVPQKSMQPRAFSVMPLVRSTFAVVLCWTNSVARSGRLVVFLDQSLVVL